MTVAFVTNFCPHYRVRTFEILAERLDVEFLFFSGGDEWYWPSSYGTRRGNFRHEYLPGFDVAGTRVTPRLVRRLWSRRYDVVVKCINGRFALPAAYATARLRSTPFVLWTGLWHRLETPVHRLLHPITRYVYRRSDAVAVYGEHVRQFLIEEEGVDPDRIFVAPHATESDLYRAPPSTTRLTDLRRRLEVPDETTVVLYAGRLETAKGVDLLLEAFLSLERRDVHLLFVGDGSRRKALESASQRAGCGERVRFAGSVAPEDISFYYAVADLLALPSVTTPTFKEPWGLVVNEAFQQGVPVVVSDAVGAAAGGLAEDDRTAVVVPEGDPAALARGLERLLDDPALRRRLGSEARTRIAAWSNERMVDGFLRAIDHARSRRGAS